MQLPPLTSWPKTTKRAVALQQALRDRVVKVDRWDQIAVVAGVDVGFEEAGKIARAAVAVLEFPSLKLIDQGIAREKTRFPYVPGLLSFREIPVVMKALRRLTIAPHLLLCDGQGYAHPRRFGFACHLGVLTDTPSIGVAKSRLIGTHDEPGQQKGSFVPLAHQGEEIGAVVRTRTGVAPLYISIGHRMSLGSVIAWTLACVTRYRLPETTRHAHRLASGHEK